jgi:serine/threonine-protein kinase
VQGSASLFDEGRFGPVYRSHDPETNRPVLIRTFAEPLSPEDQARLVDALTLLCETPLDHPSVARPLVAGVEDGRPFLVHTLLPGVSLQPFLREQGRQPFADVVLRVTQLAAAIDFAAAAGVHHGDLSPRDVIVAPDATGISGFGVVQALKDSGLLDEGPAPSQSGDIEALARVAFELLEGRAPEGAFDARSLSTEGADTARLQQAFAAALGRDPNLRPSSALEFAAALQHARLDAPSTAAPAPTDVPLAHAGAAGAATVEADLPLREAFSLREENETARFTDVEPTISRPAPPPPSTATRTVEPVLRRDAPSAPARDTVIRERPQPSPMPARDTAVRQERPAPRPMFGAVASPVPAAKPRERSGGWFIVAASLAIGLLSGFAAGYVTGLRGDPLPAPRFAADVLRPSAPDEAPSPATGASSDAAPPAANGAAGAVIESGPRIEKPQIESRDLEPGSATPDPGSGTVPPARAGAPSAPSPAAAPGAANSGLGGETAGPPAPSPASPPSSAPSRTPATAPQPAVPDPRVARDTPGGLQVLSRPEGAEVFLDGALVGRTPLVLPSLRPGPYDVRLELAGHRRWVTNVQVAPGERARVAASLEQ